jgi:hypothetical protein
MVSSSFCFPVFACHGSGSISASVFAALPSAFCFSRLLSRISLFAWKLTLFPFVGKGKKGGRNGDNDNPSGGWRSNSSTTNARGDTTSNNGGGDNGSSNGGGSVADDDVDEDGFSAVPRGKRGGRARGGRGGRGKAVVSAGERGGNGGTGEKSMLGKMRGFDDDKESVVGSENGWAKDWAE